MSFKDIFDQADRLSGVLHFTTKGAALRRASEARSSAVAASRHAGRGSGGVLNRAAWIVSKTRMSSFSFVFSYP